MNDLGLIWQFSPNSLPLHPNFIIMLKQIINARIHTPSGWIEGGSIVVSGATISEVKTDSLAVEKATIIDAEGAIVAPGCIDMHVHGAGGCDFINGDETSFQTIINVHANHGTTSIYPSLASADVNSYVKAASTCATLMEQPNSPILGLHLEGPYFNIKKAGGQQARFITNPIEADYRMLLERFPIIARWDAAPETDGAMVFARYITEKGVVAGIAHTDADYPVVKEAWQHGYSHATHFYNGMSGFHNLNGYKHEGTVESVYLIENMTIELICDGLHVPPPMMQLAYNIKGADKMAIVTDSLAYTHTDIKEDKAAGVIIENGVCKLAHNGVLAGSTATMDKMIKVLATTTSIPLHDIFRMASTTPAEIMGVSARKGSIEKGKDADFVLFDPKTLLLRKVFRAGELV